jgi:hypothetical protein
LLGLGQPPRPPDTQVLYEHGDQRPTHDSRC